MCGNTLRAIFVEMCRRHPLSDYRTIVVCHIFFNLSFLDILFSFSNTISINFWFEAKNGSKVDDARKKKTNATDIEAENNKESHQEYDNPRENKEQPEDSEETLKEHSEETGTSDSEQISEHSDESKADETMAKGAEEEKDGKEFEETDLNQEEEDVKEIELSAAEYLILLRETEISLYKATLSHAKVGCTKNAKIKLFTNKQNSIKQTNEHLK